RHADIAVERLTWVTGAALLLGMILLARGAFRLKGHFHDRHYKPVPDRNRADAVGIADRPLSWWAVRRVMEYSGRSNIWLAGGFGLVYAAYMLRGDSGAGRGGQTVF